MTRTPLHDFTTELERNLTAAAATESHRGPLRRAGRTVLAAPGPAAGIGAAAIVVLIVVALTLTGPGQTTTALGAPPATRLPTVTLPAQDARIPRDLRSAGSLRNARSLAPAAPGAYLLPNHGQWCLAVPDEKTAQPSREFGVSCTSDADFRRNGLDLTLVNGTDSTVVFVLPDGDTDPRIRLATGATRPITARNGVVRVSGTFTAGDALNLTRPDGKTRRIALPEPVSTEPKPGDLRDCGDGRIVPLADGCG